MKVYKISELDTEYCKDARVVFVDDLKKELEYKKKTHEELNAANFMPYSNGVIVTCDELLGEVNK